MGRGGSRTRILDEAHLMTNSEEVSRTCSGSSARDFRVRGPAGKAGCQMSDAQARFRHTPKTKAGTAGTAKTRAGIAYRAKVSQKAGFPGCSSEGGPYGEKRWDRTACLDRSPLAAWSCTWCCREALASTLLGRIPREVVRSSGCGGGCEGFSDVLVCFLVLPPGPCSQGSIAGGCPAKRRTQVSGWSPEVGLCWLVDGSTVAPVVCRWCSAQVERPIRAGSE